MQSNAKAVALIRDLADVLSKRMSGLNSIRQAFDANNWPYLVASANGNEAAGQPVLLIRLSNVDAVSKDIFGNQTNAYAPHILELAYELQATPNIGDSFVSHADRMAAELEAARVGARFQLKELANGTAVTAANVSAASAVADLDQLYWPTKSV
jgi:hypothetical protein